MSTTRTKKQHYNNNSYHQGGVLPTDVQMSLLDYLKANRNRGWHWKNYYDCNGSYCHPPCNRNHNTNQKNQNNNAIICYYCRKPGHIAWECFHNPSNKRGGTFWRGNQRGRFQPYSSFGKWDGRLNTAADTGKQSDSNGAMNTAWNILPKKLK